MNLLLPITALGALFFLNSKKTTVKTSAKTTINKPCLSDDCQWYCAGNQPGNLEGFDFSKELYNNQKLYAKHIDKYINDPDFGIQSLTKELLKTWKWGKCKSVKSDVSIDDTLTLRYAYANALPTSAFYLALTEKITDYALAMWLSNEYPKILNSLGLLTPGDYKLDVLQPRFDQVTPEVLASMLSKLYILVPEFRNIQAELLASILKIQLSQVVEVETKTNCYKVIKMQYGDFSSLSGKLDPAYIKLFDKIFDAIILANPK